MKFKALRTKREPKEFVVIDTIDNTMIMYTCSLPHPQPETATLEGMKEYYKKYCPLPDTITLDDLEMVELEFTEAFPIPSDSRINKGCIYYPCHERSKLEDCTFCYCPIYPCEISERGKWLENGKWDCSNCTWIHEKHRVDKLFVFLNKNMVR